MRRATKSAAAPGARTTACGWQLQSAMDQRTCKRIGDSLYASIVRLVDDLSPDRPDLARALYSEARRVPLTAARQPRLGRLYRPAPLRPVLYAALDAGIIDSVAFDRLMIYRARARGAAPHNIGSPSDSESSGSGSVGVGSPLVDGASERR